MNPAATVPCPSRQELERLFQGQLPYSQVEQLSQHLEKCDPCVRTVQGLNVDDTLVEVVRQQAKALGKPPDAVLKNLQQRLRGLHAAVAGNDGPGADVTRDLYDFLAPAQGPGELGRLGSYRVLKVLGAGGMGVVFLAEDPQLKRKVALKVMKPALAASPSAKERFLREAQATAAIKHDHIVTIHQVGEDRAIPFLAMEYLEGLSLDDFLKKKRTKIDPYAVPGALPLVQILRIGRDIARGLAAAHQRGLIHRDIKPGNIWLEAPQGRVKILDFGLARGTAEDQGLTQPGAIVGTPGYMGPEQASGQSVDHRTDLFSLGCVLYRLCTGQAPFKGATPMAVLMALSLETPKSVREINPALPEALADLVARLMAKEPGGRPGSAKEVVEALQAIERDQVGVLPVLPPRRKTEMPKHGGVEPQPTANHEAPTLIAAPRRRRRIMPAVVVGLALLVGGGLLLGQFLGQVAYTDGKPTEKNVAEGSRVEMTTVSKKDKASNTGSNPTTSKVIGKKGKGGPGEPPRGFDVFRAGIERGKVESVEYDVTNPKAVGTKAKMNVYTPPGYAKDAKYPVLYLLHHGGKADEKTWVKEDAADIILDNLHAEKKLVPMIVVMIKGGAADVVKDVIPHVESQYGVQADRESRALAGHHDGGKWALNSGLNRQSRFAWVGGFQASLEEKTPPGTLCPDPEASRKQLRLLWLFYNSKGPLGGVNTALHNFLEEKQVPHLWNDVGSRRAALYHFTQLLFRPKEEGPK